MLEVAFRNFKFTNTPSVNQENPFFSIVGQLDSITQSDLESTKDEQLQNLKQRGKYINQECIAIQRSVTQPDLVSTRDEHAQLLIQRVKYFNQGSIAAQLSALFDLAKEENADSPGIDVQSLTSFHGFLMLYKIKRPVLTLTPDNRIYASWNIDQGKFSIHFLADGEIRFVLFIKNDRHTKFKIRTSGAATCDKLLDIIPSHTLNDWVIDEGRTNSRS